MHQHQINSQSNTTNSETSHVSSAHSISFVVQNTMPWRTSTNGSSIVCLTSEEDAVSQRLHFRYDRATAASEKRKFANEDRLQCWQDRMIHVAWHHHFGHSLSHARPDFKIIRYLYKEEFIDKAEYRELWNLRQQASRSPQIVPSPPDLPPHVVPELKERRKAPALDVTIESTECLNKDFIV